MPPLDCQKSPAGLFDRFFAVSCAHNLAPVGGQIPHLEPEKCFLPGTEGELLRRSKRGHPGVRPGKKRFSFYLPPQAANSARLF